MKYKLIYTTCVLLLATTILQAQKIIPLYAGAAPGSEKWNWQQQTSDSNLFHTRIVYNVVNPSLLAYLPSANIATATALVIAPGGAFHTLSIDNEGIDVAKWLNEKGIAVFVLQYRLVRSLTNDPSTEVLKKLSNFKKLDEENDSVVTMAIADGLKAVEYVRSHAAEYNINAKRIGILGFSAGGTVTMGTVFNAGVDNRPDFAAPVYAYMNALKNQVIPVNAPALFICAASDDQLGMATHSSELYTKWIKAGKKAELHMYAKGGHGFGMRKNNLPADKWIEVFYNWLLLSGY